MEKKLAKRKSLRGKYKRYAAAIVGTAIMTGAALPGIPLFSKAFASENPTSPPIKNEQMTKSARNGWHQHKNDWPSSDDNQAWYENGHIYYLNDHNRYSEHQRDGYFQDVSSPVDFVKTYATQYGFDTLRDSFTLIHQGRYKATVQVINKATGQRFKLDLERNYGDWQVVVIRGIGDENFPATYHAVSRL
ncbi:hypothetical protein [Pelosinus sp. sgz500959]|uniref:hypothetical protein n=1 Tax=Pelosinus sp. sgz500959 TaxID=3242472 RepID=UPI00366B276E